MGNRFIRMTKKESKDVGSRSKRMGRSQRKLLGEEELLHRQALSMVLQQQQLSQRFDGSMSRRIGSTSSRRRTLSEDPISNGKQQPDFLENVKFKKIVLIHGEGFGAWCWYKTIVLLEEAGLLPTALDLAGSGIDLADTPSITTVAEYSRPLIEYLKDLPDDEKVILVGHSSGGACISYALEQYPQKISKAVFLCAAMVSDGQRPFDVFAEGLGSAELFMQESKFLIYGNGKDKPPTGFMFEKQQIKGLYFNQSPSKDVALAMVSMRPIPLGPIMEKLSLSPEKYGTSRRFFIQTLDDRALSPDVQEKLLRENPPEGIFKIKGSDHCPFFSKPQSLHKVLLEIAQIP
ncbi:putative methylesterase 14 chloroplastic [Tripterygium wilfordii]|uniref:Putative methylesterase 14 chloroplastic n=1 Tax=Tripterygium wilfordii TaxID=458696 RepID=A0A7J7DD64_TRIWF|nr:putative methylesterase 14, chloroplastic [Tripterygium wilfordii]KAF5744209.1 putative methylesterase 14 chloroplastic [Tripterygium wilfordii]